MAAADQQGYKVGVSEDPSWGGIIAPHGELLPRAFDHLDEADARALGQALELVYEAFHKAARVVGERSASEYLRDEVLRLVSREHPRRPGRVPRDLRRRLIASSGACGRCGAGADLTIDHEVPVVLGGSDGEWNLTVLCRTCNARKGWRLW